MQSHPAAGTTPYRQQALATWGCAIWNGVMFQGHERHPHSQGTCVTGAGPAHTVVTGTLQGTAWCAPIRWRQWQQWHGGAAPCGPLGLSCSCSARGWSPTCSRHLSSCQGRSGMPPARFSLSGGAQQLWARCSSAVLLQGLNDTKHPRILPQIPPVCDAQVVATASKAFTSLAASTPGFPWCSRVGSARA